MPPSPTTSFASILASANECLAIKQPFASLPKDEASAKQGADGAVHVLTQWRAVGIRRDARG
jgi:hypothetical protein